MNFVARIVANQATITKKAVLILLMENLWPFNTVLAKVCFFEFFFKKKKINTIVLLFSFLILEKKKVSGFLSQDDVVIAGAHVKNVVFGEVNNEVTLVSCFFRNKKFSKFHLMFQRRKCNQCVRQSPD